MEKMLNILDSAVQEISKLKGEVVKVIHDYNAQVEDFNNKRIELNKKRKSIIEREKAVVKIEDVVALEAEAKALMKEVVNSKTALQKERDDFNFFISTERGKVATERNQVIEDGKQIKAEYEAQKKERALLDNDKKTYKQKIASGLVDLANKK